MAALGISSFLLFGYLEYFDSNLNKNKISIQGYFDGVDFSKKKIFVLGSSSTDVLNFTRLDEYLLEHNMGNYETFNLAENGDRPTKRIKEIDEIISAKPDLVFYGLGMREFGFDLYSHGSSNCPPLRSDALFSVNQKIQEFENKENTTKMQNVSSKKVFEPISELRQKISDSGFFKTGFDFVEPKFATVSILKLAFDQHEEDKTNQDILINKNYTFLKKQGGVYSITSNDRLQASIDGLVLGYCEQIHKEEIGNLEQILTKLKEHDIQIILFVAPYSGPYVNAISNMGIRHYYDALQEVSQKFDVDIYSFLTKYSDQEIFYDNTHVAANPQSIVFTNDFAKLLLDEIISNENQDKIKYEKQKINLQENQDSTYKNMDFTSSDLSNLRFNQEDLSNKVFSNKNFSFSKFTQTNLERANMANSNMTHTVFDESNLFYANLTHTDLSFSSFVGSNLDFVDFTDSVIHNTDFRYSSILGLKLNHQKISHVDFKGANLFGADFSYSILDDVDFSGAQLSAANFKGSSLKGADFKASDLTNADLSFSDLSNSSLSSAILEGVNLSHSSLRNAFLDFAVLPGVDLSTSDISGTLLLAATMDDSNIPNGNFSHINAKHVDLTRSNLAGSDFSFGDFSAANFSYANLTNANFTNTNLQFANLTGSILTNADMRCFDHILCIPSK